MKPETIRCRRVIKKARRLAQNLAKPTGVFKAAQKNVSDLQGNEETTYAAGGTWERESQGPGETGKNEL